VGQATLNAANGLELGCLTIGAMLVWLFFENLGKGTHLRQAMQGRLITTPRRATHRQHGSGLWD